MDNNKEFDKFIRDGVSDIEFAGEKDSWELLDYRLKEKVKTKRRNRLLTILFSGLVIAGSTFFLIPSGEKQANVKINTGKSAPQLPPVINSLRPLKEEKGIQANEQERFLQPLKKIEEISSVTVISKEVELPENNVLVNSSSPVPGIKADVSLTYSEEELADLVNSSSWDTDIFRIEITNVGKEINSSYSDFAPVISADGATMFFTSRRPVSEKELKQQKQVMEHIYSSSLNGKKKKWGNTFVLPETFNLEGRNNSVIGLSADGQRLLLYRDDLRGNGDIYQSELTENGWSTPEILPAPVNTEYHESSAGFSPDGKTIYVVSDRPGGAGGRDIWYCTLDANGKWSNATNLGLPVNSPQNEEGIFIYSDNKTIYFSSNRNDGWGGYDVYRTVRQADGSWSAPVNMGTPINTAGDDVYFVLGADGITGYYSSVRPDSNGEKDIYKVTFVLVRDKNISPKQ